jgi:glycosyltransferase involved in cell wall biosynthesis
VTAAEDRLRVCLYSGLNVSADAISNSLRLRLRVLGELGDEGFPIEATAFVQGTDDPDGRVLGTPTAFDAIGNPRFGTADLHLFEFGVAYELFDLIFLAARFAPTGAVYHNVTPVELVSEGNRAAIERSLRQRYNLFAADHVACVSELNRRDLLELGLPEDRLSVAPLPPTVLPAASRERFADAGPGPLRVLFVGRLVRAKGVLELLDALERALPHAPDIELTLVGNEQLSEPEVASEVRRRVAEPPLAGKARFLGRVDDETLADLYASADVLAMPSYHEGYCVPAVEAMAAGAYVVAYDAANLPFVLAGLGSLVPPGDLAALASALVELARRFQAAREAGAGTEVLLPATRGEMAEDAWRSAVAGHVAHHSYPAFRRSFTGLLALLAARRPGGAPGWLAGFAEVPA